MEQINQSFQATIARLGLNICAAIGANGISLKDATEQYIVQNWNISGISSEIAVQADSNQTYGRWLFYMHGHSNPDQINKPFMVYDLVRDLWYMHILSESDTPCNYTELERIYEEKYNEERGYDPKVSWSRYFSLLKQCLYSDSQIEQIWGLLRLSREDIRNGLDSLLKFFTARDLTFISQVYPVADKIHTQQIETQKQPSQYTPVPQTSQEELYKPTENQEIEQELLKQIEEEINNCHAIIEKQATDIKYLERVNHDCEINLKNAQKDEVRKILEALTAKRFGSPLSELYLLMRNQDTPDNVRAVAVNLFAALESLDISLFRTNQIGQPVLLTSDTQKVYVPADGEEITLEDEVTIRYPGYRYCGKMIICPVIEKVRK